MSVQNPMQPSGPRPSGPGSTKRWYQRWWIWVLVGVTVFIVLPIGACTAAVGGLLAIGAASGGSGTSTSTAAPVSTAPPTPSATPSPSASPSTSPTPSPSDSEEESELVAVPNVVGMPGDEARDALEEAGFEVDWTNETVFAPSNWVVISQSATDAEEGAEIGLEVARPEATVTPTSPAAPVAPGPVDSIAAQIACDAYGEQLYPYGFDAHWIIGVYANEQRGEQWFWKVDVTITNAFGAEYEAVMECFAGGTEDAAIVQDFLVY